MVDFWRLPVYIEDNGNIASPYWVMNRFVSGKEK